MIDRYLSSYIPRPTPPLPPPPGRHVDTNKRRRQTKDERRDTGAVQFALSTAQAQQQDDLSLQGYLTCFSHYLSLIIPTVSSWHAGECPILFFYCLNYLPTYILHRGRASAGVYPLRACRTISRRLHVHSTVYLLHASSSLPLPSATLQTEIRLSVTDTASSFSSTSADPPACQHDSLSLSTCLQVSLRHNSGPKILLSPTQTKHPEHRQRAARLLTRLDSTLPGPVTVLGFHMHAFASLCFTAYPPRHLTPA